MIGKGNLLEGLYVLDAHFLQPGNQDIDKTFTPSITLVNVIRRHVWHSRLGHLSMKRLNLLKNVLHFSHDHKMNNIPCSACPLAKQRRLSFVSHNHLSKCAFNLIHCDIWGPYHVPTYNEHRYFLTLVDDCTRFTWVYLMKHKSNAKYIVPKFFSLIETQFHKVIKGFRSDNAPEL